MADTTDDKSPAESAGASASAPAASAGDDDDRAGFVQRLQRAWRETVGTYATEEGITRNLMQRLVDFGALSRDESANVLVDFKKRIEQNRKELDRRVDESIKRATDRLTIPSPADLEKLRARVAELEQRVAGAERRKP